MDKNKTYYVAVEKDLEILSDDLQEKIEHVLDDEEINGNTDEFYVMEVKLVKKFVKTRGFKEEEI